MLYPLDYATSIRPDMRFTPHVTVAAIAEMDGRFLMVRERIEGRLCYNQPAGHLEANESLIDAVTRETLEETAWRFTPEALVGLYRWLSPDGTTFLRATFCGRAEDHDAGRTLDAGIEAAPWLTPEDIRGRAAALRSPLVLRSLDDYLGGIRHSLDLIRDIA